MKHEQIAQLLPEVFRTTLAPHTPLGALLEIMEALHAPVEEVLAEIDKVFDPYHTPDAFVPMLASWVDLDRFFRQRSEGVDMNGSTPLSSGMGQLRELIVAAGELSQWRGTSKGLIRFLELATGVSGFEIDEQVGTEGGLPRPFHIEVRAPASSAQHKALIEQVLEQEKPAYVTFQLVFMP
jgi:phage tail-like protein